MLEKSVEVIKGVKSERCVRMNIVSCPPVVTVIIKRPDLRHQLGFSVQVTFKSNQVNSRINDILEWNHLFTDAWWNR